VGEPKSLLICKAGRPIGGADGTGTYTRMMLGASVALSGARASEFGVAEVSIAGTWGAAATPVDVAHACVVAVGAQG